MGFICQSLLYILNSEKKTVQVDKFKARFIPDLALKFFHSNPKKVVDHPIIISSIFFLL
jgi:hypothetical protein